ncbi:MAG: hypothetical protein PHE93_03795 [Clostridia bacterium]|nr:hypothetical protein [Clostridia bacterium]
MANQVKDSGNRAKSGKATSANQTNRSTNNATDCSTKNSYEMNTHTSNPTGRSGNAGTEAAKRSTSNVKGTTKKK